MTFEVGGKVGPYEIERQIGSGGMATVYRAFQPKLERSVAIKVMHYNFSQDPNFLARFEREARIVARLDHPNIVPIYDYDELNGQPFLVMKYVDGMTLKTLLRKSALSPEDTLQLLVPVADALSYAHNQGVLHRDVKPSNIIIDQEGRPYLTDFGLARIAQQGESTMSADTMLGTPHYISPEQAQGHIDLDARADVYSLGIILYETVTGRVPFQADSSFAVIHDHIYNIPPAPRSLRDDIPEAVEEVLLQALAKDPDDRFNSPNQLLRAYEHALTDSYISRTKPKNTPDTNSQRAANSGRTADSGRPRISIPTPNPPKPPQPPRLGDSANPFDDLKIAGEQIKAAFQEVGRAFGSQKPSRMIPRPDSKWMKEGPEGPGFYTKLEMENHEQSLSLEERVRRRVQRKLKARNEIQSTATVFAGLSVMFWGIWLVWMFGEFPWPIVPMIIFSIIIAVQIGEYNHEFGSGYEREQRMIRDEIERARRDEGAYEDAYTEDSKRKNDTPGYARRMRARQVRLTEDGELTESFIEDLDEDQQARR